MRPIFYNPAFLTTEELVRGFVVRHAELDAIVDVLAHDAGPAHQHLLVLGGRGLGKSTLVHRVVAEVRARPDLESRFLPLLFPEEAYEVGNLGEFWLEALGRLVHQSGDPRWRSLHAELRLDRDGDRVARIASDAIRTHAREVQRVVLLVVENLDMVLEQVSERDAWGLRQVLQTDPSVLLIATALRPFDAITDHDQPFYEGFRRIELQALDALEIETMWAAASGHALGRDRARAMRVLTGGNPRMVALVARLTEGHSLARVLEDLTQLVDQHTDYFKSNIEALDGQNRRVFLALATLWSASTAGQVAEEARLDSNVASAVLGRLEHQGRVEVVGRKGKNKLYQVAERLYNIYYLMRRGGGQDARIRALTEFMLLLYEPEALGDAVRKLRVEGESGFEHAGTWMRSLLAACPDADTRALLLREFPAEVIAELDPKQLRRSKKNPKELAALLSGPAGKRFVKAGNRLLAARAFDGDDQLLGVLDGVLAQGGGDAPAPWIWLAMHDPELLDGRAGAAAGRAAIIADSLMLVFSVNIRGLALGRKWQAVRPALPPVPGSRGASQLRAMLDLWLDPTNVTVAKEVALAGSMLLPGMIDRVVSDGKADVWRVLAEGLGDRSNPPPWHRLNRVRLYLALGEFSSARGEAAALSALGTRPAQAAHLAALIEHAAGDLDACLRHLARALELDPTEAAAELLASLPLEPDLGLKLGTVLVQKLPDHWAGWTVLGRHHPDAVLRLLQLHPYRFIRGASPPSGLARGVVYATDRRLWERALEIHPDLDPSDLDLAIALCRLEGLVGRPDRALARYERLAARQDLREARSPALIDLGLALAASGQAEGAARALQGSPVYRPLVLALAPDLLEPAPSAEERALAEDVAERLDSLRNGANVWATQPPATARFPEPEAFAPVAPTPAPTPTKRRKQRPKAASEH